MQFIWAPKQGLIECSTNSLRLEARQYSSRCWQSKRADKGRYGYGALDNVSVQTQCRCKRRGFVARHHRSTQPKPPATWPDKPCRVGRVRSQPQPPSPTSPPLAGPLSVILRAALDLEQPVLVVPLERLGHHRLAQAAGQVAHSVVGIVPREPTHGAKLIKGSRFWQNWPIASGKNSAFALVIQ